VAHLLLDEVKPGIVKRTVKRIKQPGRFGLAFYIGSREIFFGFQMTNIEIQKRIVRTLPGKSLFVPNDN
jgi:hypothetical protein